MMTGKWIFKINAAVTVGVALAVMGGCVASEPVKKVEQTELVYPAAPDPPRFYFERTLRSSMDVDTSTKDAGMDISALMTGQDATTSGFSFGKPFGIAASKGKVYVGDTLRRSVMVFDPGTGSFSEIGKSEPGSLTKPLGLRTDAKGNLYVVDATAKRVMAYDAEGKFLRSYGSKDDFEHPTGVAVAPDGSRVFVVDTGSSQGKEENHRVRVYDGASGAHMFDIGRRGPENGQFNLARDAVVGPDGLLYVVDGGNFRMQAFTQEGKFVKTFGTVGRRLGQFARPKGVAMDREGNLYISDASHANFQIFNEKGQLMMFVGGRGAGDAPGSYVLPAMLAVDEDGRVYMVDQALKKVDVFRPAAIKEDEGALGIGFKKLKAGDIPKKKKDGEKEKTPAKAETAAPSQTAPAVDNDAEEDEAPLPPEEPKKAEPKPAEPKKTETKKGKR